METHPENCETVDEKIARLRRVIEHANRSIEMWGPGKYRDATVTFYSRSSEPTRATQRDRTATR
jgi:hypothetical protein